MSRVLVSVVCGDAKRRVDEDLHRAHDGGDHPVDRERTIGCRLLIPVQALKTDIQEPILMVHELPRVPPAFFVAELRQDSYAAIHQDMDKACIQQIPVRLCKSVPAKVAG